MTIHKNTILWVDDEIDLLRPHVLFLEEKGYNVVTVTNAEDGIEKVRRENIDLILLDEMLNGMDGLTALTEFKEINSSLPVVMVTKSEEESLMEDAIGAKIDDYLTKPVNPSQILLICKKHLESKQITSQKISRDYTMEFNKISAQLMGPMEWQDWINLHIKLSEWDVELEEHPDLGFQQMLDDQRKECNSNFAKFVESNYQNWLYDSDRPPLSVDIIKNYVAPHVKNGKNTVLLVLDALRLDQWLVLEPLLQNYFKIDKDYYYSILPTATPYARNAIFSGFFPTEIEKYYPGFWKMSNEEDDVSLNHREDEFLIDQLNRLKIEVKPSPRYTKILDSTESKELSKKIDEFAQTPLSAIVANFVDILGHQRSSNKLLKEMIPNEAAFRSMARSWFEHSELFNSLKYLAQNGNTVIITTDHGTIRSKHGTKVIGDRETSTSLRYKYGKNLKVNTKDAMLIKEPQKYKLPVRGVNTNYIIAKDDKYFVYPTNYNHYLHYYADSFQHGGISLEEMILPIVTMESK